MTTRGFALRCAGMGVLAALGACDGHDVGTQCISSDGSQNGTVVYGRCNDGLYCSTNSGTCVAPFPEGAPCDPRCNEHAPCNDRCEDGLLCGLSLTCEPPAGEGERCTSTDQCATGLLCNQGYLPEEVQFGECRPPSESGEPCSYTQYRVASSASGVGCAPDVICTPAPAPTRDQIGATPADQTCPEVDASCGFAGTCDIEHLAADGEACLGDVGCAEGHVCYVIGHPQAPTGTAGFECVGSSQDCYIGAWPGLCGPPGLPVRLGSCTDTPCAPGHLCDRNGVCQPRWSVGDGVPCTEWSTGLANDDFCAIGLYCRAGSPPRCGP